MMPPAPAVAEQSQLVLQQDPVQQAAAQAAESVGEAMEQLSYGFKVGRAVTAAADRTSNWLVKAKHTLGPTHQKMYEDMLNALVQVQMHHTQTHLHNVKVAARLKTARDLVDSVFLKVQANFRLDGAAQSGPLLHKYDPTAVHTDLARLERVVSDLKALPELEQQGTIHSMQVFATAHAQLFSDDTIGETQAKMGKLFRVWDDQYKLLERRKALMLQLCVQEADLASCEETVRMGTELVQRLEEQMKEVRKQKADIEPDARRMNQHVVRFREAALKEMETLEKRKKDMEDREAQAIQDIDSKARQLEAELHSAGATGNNVIICLDRSASMAGRRWEQALAAIDGLTRTLEDVGHHAVVSAVVFNATANLLFYNRPLGPEAAAELHKCSPDGGTAYGPAWAEVERCAKLVGQKEMRTLVIFVTDGLANDVAAASDVAARMHKDATEFSGMTTFVVNIDREVPQSVLEPLVKAGNGGKLSDDVLGERVMLLAGVDAADLATHFKTIADFANKRATLLTHQLVRVRATIKQRRKEQTSTLEWLHGMHARQADFLEEQARRARLGEVKERERCQEIIDFLEAKERDLRNTHEIESTLVYNSRAKITTLKDFVEQARSMLNEEAHKRSMDSLVSQEKLSVEELAMVSQVKQVLMEHFGTSDFKELQGRRREVAEMRGLLSGSLVLQEVQAGFHYHLEHFLEKLIDDVRRPLHIAGLEEKAPFVMPKICKDRGIDAPCGDVVTCFKAYLVHEATKRGDKYEDAPDTILDCLGSPEALFGCCGLLEEDDVKQMKEDTVDQLTEAFWRQQGLEDDLKEVTALGKTVRDLQKRLKGSKDREERAEIGAQLKEAKEELAAARDAVKQEQGDVQGELRAVVRMTKDVMEQLGVAYNAEYNALVLKNLQMYGVLYGHTVRRSMEAYVLQVGQESRQLAVAATCAPSGSGGHAVLGAEGGR